MLTEEELENLLEMETATPIRAGVRTAARKPAKEAEWSKRLFDDFKNRGETNDQQGQGIQIHAGDAPGAGGEAG